MFPDSLVILLVVSFHHGVVVLSVTGLRRAASGTRRGMLFAA